MKERPILFSGPMVRAILDGQKTQTRRVVKPQRHPYGNMLSEQEVADEFLTETCAVRCPYGQPGDLLWVRETWNAGEAVDGDCCEPYTKIPKRKPAEYWLSYAASDPHDIPFRPSIHMPRWASRLTLEITAVRVERLQDISEVDAAAEGVEVEDYGEEMPDGTGSHDYTCIPNYRRLWESINGLGSWAKNPWVWVIEFKKL